MAHRGRMATALLAFTLGISLAVTATAPAAASSPPAPASPTGNAPPPAQTAPPATLVDFDSFVTGVMADWQVPGLAVGVVKDGEVLYARGFGERDITTGAPVTTETLFGIGSATKAFTATAFQALVEEGVLDWDLPVRTYIPDLDLADPLVAERVTPRDWALHRTGVAQVDIPWLFNPGLDAQTFIRNLEHLGFQEEFRTSFSYNNLGYIILGQVMEEATGRPWEEIVQERVLAPLGMESTNFSIDALQAAADHSRVYAVRDGQVEEIPYTVVGAAGPAGAINSNLEEMLKWVQMHLGRGRLGETQVISPTGAAEMHSARITLPGGYGSFSGYGLGWFVETYRDHFHVHHGGRTPGFSAMVSMLPNDGIGVVVLANADGTPAAHIVAMGALDRLLGLEPIDWNGMALASVAAHTPDQEPGAAATAPPMHPLQDYVGTYAHPLYGTLRVQEADGRLQAVYYTATMPLKHLHYDHFTGPLGERVGLHVPFQFITNREGEVERVEVDFELSGNPISFQRRPAERLQDPAFLSRLTGRYDLKGEVVTVTLKGTELEMTLPGQPPYTLVPQGENGFVLKGVESVTVRFQVDAAGEQAEAMVVTQSGYPFELPRIDE